MAIESRTSVLIVGAGPVGLALAAELGSRGVSTLLVERNDSRARSARIMLISVATMEWCRRMGIDQKVRHWGFPMDYPLDNVWVTSLTGYELARVPMPSMGDGRPTEFSPEYQCHCPQTWFDPILRDHAMTFPSVEFRWRTELESFVQDGDGVTATVTDQETGRRYEVRADYLAACDGNQSSIRDMLGIAMRGHPVIDHSLSIEFLSKELLQVHDKGKALRYVAVGPEGVWASLMAVDGRERWRIILYGVAEDPSTTDVPAVIRRLVGRDFDFRVDSAKPWTRKALIADRFQDGRVLLVGDAAHTHPPNGGFGMNTGIGDAANLGWKLAAVLEGWAPPALLESYDIERRPVCHRVIDEAMKEFRRFTMSPEVPHIESPTPRGARARQEIGGAIQKAYTEARGWDRLGIFLGHIYFPSPIVVDDGKPLPPDDTYGYTPTSHPGARAPHAWIGENRSLLDLFGKTYVLLRLGSNAPDAGELVSAARARRVPLAVHDVPATEVRELYQVPLALVRPDGHVAWRGEKLPPDCTALVDRVRGAGTRAAAKVAL